jgi:tetratricopeptide (TPR) repeat protein
MGSDQDQMGQEGTSSQLPGWVRELALGLAAAILAVAVQKLSDAEWFSKFSIVGAVALLVGVAVAVVVRLRSRWARSLYVVLLALIVLSLSIIGAVRLYHHFHPSHKEVILVAEFAGPSPEKYAVTDTVLANLRSTLARYRNIEVVPLRRKITEETSDIARTEGNKRNATIVIWGWYAPGKRQVEVSVHFLVLHPPPDLPDFGLRTDGQVQIWKVSHLEDFVLQVRLSHQMTYLSLVTVGLTRFSAEDYEGTIPYLTDALAQANDQREGLNPEAVYFYRGTAHLYAGDPSQAISDLTQAIKLNPDLYEAYLNRADAYGDIREVSKALRDTTRAIELDNRQPDAYILRALIYVLKKEWQKAARDVDRASELHAPAELVHLIRGTVLVDAGDADTAIAEFTEAAKTKALEYNALVGRGRAYFDRAYFDKKDLDQAIQDHSQAISLNPERDTAYYYRAAAYAARGNFDEAFKDLDAALERNPRLAIAYSLRGQIYVLLDQAPRAIQEYSRAIQGDPALYIAYLGRGTAYQTLGQKVQALDDFMMVVEHSGDADEVESARQQIRSLQRG